MNRRPGWNRLAMAALLALSGLPSLAVDKVKTAWDENADFSRFHTYAWGELPPTARPLLAIEIKADIDEQLRNKGLKESSTAPDLTVNYYGALEGELSVPPVDPTYASTGGVPFPDALRWSERGDVRGSVAVPKGTLVVEVRDSTTRRTLWRSTAKGALHTKSSKLQKQVQDSVSRMFRDFPPPQQRGH